MKLNRKKVIGGFFFLTLALALMAFWIFNIASSVNDKIAWTDAHVHLNPDLSTLSFHGERPSFFEPETLDRIAVDSGSSYLHWTHARMRLNKLEFRYMKARGWTSRLLSWTRHAVVTKCRNPFMPVRNPFKPIGRMKPPVTSEISVDIPMGNDPSDGMPLSLFMSPDNRVPYALIIQVGRGG
jgi:hypothetical protein